MAERDRVGRNERTDEPVAVEHEPIAWIARTLRRQGMTPEQIESVLNADEPVALRRHLEVHRERLEERLADQLRKLRRVERLLAIRILRRGARDAGGA